VAHEQLVQKARAGRIDLYFIGDSITRRWGCSDAQYREFLANWRTNFFGWNAGNFGWGADRLQHILWRLEQGELDGVNPRVIVLLAGTNNLGDAPPQGGDERVIDEITAGIQAVLQLMRQKAPQATILLTAITPRTDRQGGTSRMPILRRINQQLATFADGKRTRFVDINGRLADESGKLFDGVTVDGLHLSVKGYQIWADALKPILRELLGPPALEDQAPPPTGDPSAKP
jgi:lysophospholipase L1-like esterase